MPKNNSSAAPRRGKNFEPRYGEKKTSFHERNGRGGAPDARGAKAGSRSPSHRGYRPNADEGSAPKARWSNEQRTGRDESHARGGRDERSYSERPARGGRPDFNGDRTERPRYNSDRNERPSYGDRNDRGARPTHGDRNDRGARPTYGDRTERPRYDNNRPARSFDGERPARREFNNDRPARSFDGDRPARSFDGERPPRRDFNSDRPARRDFNPERPARREFNSDRPARREGGFDRDRRSSGSRSDWTAKPERSARHEQHVDVVHERLQAQAIVAVEVEGVTFGDLGLGGNIVTALAELGAAAPFAIQSATIPEILAGRDVLGRGRTGSGKTIAFGAPLVENVLRSQAGQRREFARKPRALILAPTRELALQLDRTVQPIARSVGLFTTQIYGGVPQGRQVGALRKGVDIIIGTPGRIEDLINQGKLDLSDVRVAVLDEADHMCELGVLEPVQRILRETADGSQKLLFSATLDREVSALVDEFLVNPSVHEVAGEDQDSATIDHQVLVIDHRNKDQMLEQLVNRDGKTLVFARTRAYAERLAEQFYDAGIPAVSLHGDLNQARRTRNLHQLTSGSVRVMVATDVAARGIHVDDIDLVIQADAPDEYKTYLHRSGRTGRAGAEGRVVTLITRQRRRRMVEMLERAEITAPFIEAGPGDDVLDELSGQTPTAAELTA